MHLTEREHERLTIFSAAELARRRLARGRRLSAPEAIAIVCDEILEWAWDGVPLDIIIERAKDVLAADQLHPGVPDLVSHIQVEAMFPSGTALIAVDRPFGPSQVGGPGALNLEEGSIELNPSRSVLDLEVINTTDLPIYVSSHFPFAESNPGLDFDRAAAQGHRLAIPAGTSSAFPPGVVVRVELIPLSRESKQSKESK